MEIQSLEFAQIIFVLSLVQDSLPILAFLLVGMMMWILCHYILEVYDLLFDFVFTGKYI